MNQCSSEWELSHRTMQSIISQCTDHAFRKRHTSYWFIFEPWNATHHLRLNHLGSHVTILPEILGFTISRRIGQGIDVSGALFPKLRLIVMMRYTGLSLVRNHFHYVEKFLFSQIQDLNAKKQPRLLWP